MGKSLRRAAFVARFATAFPCIAMAGGAFSQERPAPIEQAPVEPADHLACRKDWRRCSDNVELIKSYVRGEGGGEVIARCRESAERKSKFGTPNWPWFDRSGKYRAGDDFPKTGIVTLVDEQIIFLDAYGSQAKTSVTCKYDLGAGEVQSIDIQQEKGRAVLDRGDDP